MVCWGWNGEVTYFFIFLMQGRPVLTIVHGCTKNNCKRSRLSSAPASATKFLSSVASSSASSASSPETVAAPIASAVATPALFACPNPQCHKVDSGLNMSLFLTCFVI